MSADYKVNLFFSAEARFTGQVPGGWSETWYTNQPTLALAVTAAKALAVDRAAILAQPCAIEALRASEMGGNRISQLIPPEAYSYFTGAGTSDTPWQAALVHMVTAEGLSRPWMCRGIPDDFYNPETAAEVMIANSWKAAVDTFIANTIVAGPWNLYGISKDLVANPKKPIIDITDPTAGTLHITTSVAHGLAVGDLVHLYFSGITPPLGTVRVKATAALNSFDVDGILQPGWSLPLAAYARRIVKALFKITDGAIERVTHRIVGRPFGEQRGRRRSAAR